MEAFEKLEVWKRSSRLCVDLYKTLSVCKDFGFKDQITRAAISIPSNIAEGYERDSRKEYVRFLKIAKGSSGELRSQLYFAIQAGLLEDTYGRGLINEATEITKMIHGLIKKLS